MMYLGQVFMIFKNHFINQISPFPLPLFQKSMKKSMPPLLNFEKKSLVPLEGIHLRCLAYPGAGGGLGKPDTYYCFEKNPIVTPKQTAMEGA